jgi:two-component system sensor histidine kinase KdpD
MSALFEELIAKKNRGVFKIYLGYAAGVGKTYAMLEEAHRLKAQGIDVVVGYVEPHDRPQTTDLTQGLEQVPYLEFQIAHQCFLEMNREAILQRRAQVVLIDELAHTNYKGLKNEKRYQDVYEILDAGINVISTMNVQHLESVAEKLAQATGTRITERLSDRILSSANQIVIVDITLEDLRERLRRGKIYKPEQAKHALAHFFTHENLSFLREICLREGAGDQIRKIEMQGLLNPTATDIAEESVLAAMSAYSDSSESILRKSLRMASHLSTRCYAVYVQTSQDDPLRINTTRQRQLQKNRKMAHELGAEIVNLIHDDVAEALLNFASQNHVRHAFFGKPEKSSLFAFFKKDIIQSFIQDSQCIDVHIVDVKKDENIPHD